MRTTLRYFSMLATIASASTFAFAQDTPQPKPRSAQPAQVRPAGAQPGALAPQSAGMGITEFFAHELRRGNEAEVELGRLASEKSENEQVKKFAEMMVEHHSQVIQQLEQFEHRGGAAPGAAGQPGALRRPAGQNETDALAAATIPEQGDRPVQGNVRRGQGNVRNSESGTDGERKPQGAPAAGGTSQATTAAGQAPGTSTPGTPRATAGQAVVGEAIAAGEPVAGQQDIVAGHMMGGQVPHQIVAVLDQAADTELQMTKEMLSEHQGQDFEMGYLGQQIMAHTCMLAKLQALKNAGPQELQQLVTQGEQTTRNHLDMAKQIAEQLKDRDSSGAKGTTRSANSSAKQPSSSERERK